MQPVRGTATANRAGVMHTSAGGPQHTVGRHSVRHPGRSPREVAQEVNPEQAEQLLLMGPGVSFIGERRQV